MCIEDVWLARHTKKVYLGTGATLSRIPGNPNRVALVFAAVQSIELRATGGLRWYRYTGNTQAASLTGSIVTQVPPNTDTVSLAVNSAVQETAVILTVRDFGLLIQDEIIITILTAGCDVWSVEGDVEFESRYAAFERGVLS
jgi:hypothetical protein